MKNFIYNSEKIVVGCDATTLRQAKTIVMVVWNQNCDLMNLGFQNLVEGDAKSIADAMFSAIEAVSEAGIANSYSRL